MRQVSCDRRHTFTLHVLELVLYAPTTLERYSTVLFPLMGPVMVDKSMGKMPFLS